MSVPSVLIPDDAACRAHRSKHGHAADCSHLPRRRVYLGRRRPTKSVRQQLCFRDYRKLFAATTPLPATLDYYTKALASLAHMYLNDTYGDCVIAGKAHSLGVWSGNDSDSGGVVLATDKEIYSQYQSICGPGDNGCVITDVLDAMKSKGFIAGGKSYPIDGYVSVDWTNRNEVMVALYLFGALTIGINLPEAWTEGGDGSTWDVTNTGIVGGHDVTCVGYDANGVWIATWGGKRLITWAAFTSRQWIEECYAPLAPLWYGNDKLAPCGVDAAALAADLAALGGGLIPPIDPTPVPVVPPVVPPPPPTPVPQVAHVPGQTAPVTVHVPFFGSISGTAQIAAVDAPVVQSPHVTVIWSDLVPDLEKLVADGMPAIAKAQTVIADIAAGNWTTAIADAAGIVATIEPIIADVKQLIADLTTSPPAPAAIRRGPLARLAFVQACATRIAGALDVTPNLTPQQKALGASYVTQALIDQAVAKLPATAVAGVVAINATLDQMTPLQAIGGLWAAIVAFFESAAGQALLKALLDAVLALLLA